MMGQVLAALKSAQHCRSRLLRQHGIGNSRRMFQHSDNFTYNCSHGTARFSTMSADYSNIAEVSIGMDNKKPSATTPANKPTEILVTAGCDAWRMDRFIKFHLPHLTFATAQQLLNSGKIRMITTADGKSHQVKINTRLTAGDVVRLPSKFGQKPLESKKKDIEELLFNGKRLQDLVLYRDDDILAINKPYGLAVQGGSKITNSIDRMLEELRFGAEELPRRVHRIDKDCSGVLLFGRNAKTAANLGRLLQANLIGKIYWAITLGVPSPGRGRIAVPIQIGTGGVVCRPELASLSRGEYRQQRGKALPAITEYTTLDKFGDHAALLELQPKWGGRKHQLRVHCAGSLQTPMLGDPKYGRPHDGVLQNLLGTSVHLCLHARAITLPRWKDGKDLLITAPLPEHMQTVMKELHLSTGY